MILTTKAFPENSAGPIQLNLEGPRAAVVVGDVRSHCRRQHQLEGKEEGVAPRAMQLPPNCP